MPVFVWEGKTRQGLVKKGSMDAPNEATVLAQLRAQAISPSKVKAKSRDLSELIPIGVGVTTRDLVIFTRQFATMIDAGLPLVQCLDILGNQQPNKRFRDALKAVKADVEQGATFADALRKHPKVWDSLYVNLVAAGEIGGILDTILNRLAVYLEKVDALKRKVKSAMVYPVTILVVAVGVVILLMVKVIPVFEKMFADFGGTLPGPTQVVLGISHWMQAYIGYVLIGAFAAFMLFRELRKRNESFLLRTDQLALMLPVFGPLLKKVAVARFSRTLSTMLSSGVPILDALDIVSRTAGNKVIENALQRTRVAIAEGRTVAEPLTEANIFPGMVVQMIGVGEQTGAMDAMLSKIADFYDDEVDNAVAGLTALMEPMMMVFLGGTIGSILIAMYLPIFTIADTIK